MCVRGTEKAWYLMKRRTQVSLGYADRVRPYPTPPEEATGHMILLIEGKYVLT